MSFVQLKNIQKTYQGNGYEAIKDATVDIEQGEFVILLGPSGCGKSTLLRMVAGLEKITGGDLIIDQKRVNDELPKDRDIAMVFQSYALYPHMTVFENMALSMKIRKIDKATIQQTVNDAAEMLNLTEYLNAKPAQLSGGQRQRVALGRAIVRRPKVFLFDEPLSNLDAKLRSKMRQEICALHKEVDATILYVTHDQVEAMTMGDKVVVLNEGIIQQIGSPKDLYERPTNKFVAGFIGSPVINFVDVDISVEDETILLGAGESFQLKVPLSLYPSLKEYSNDKVCLGVRPEDLELLEEDNSEGFVGNVSYVEYLGAECNTEVLLSKEQSLMIRTHSNRVPEGRVCVLPNLERLHFFDIETEQRLNK